MAPLSLGVRELTGDAYLRVACEVLRSEGRVWVVAEGCSMHPTVRSGDHVLLARPPARLRRGMVVLTHEQDRFVLHRVVKLDSDSVRTRGDAHFVHDAAVHRRHVLGQAVAVASRGRIAALTATTEFGMLPLLRCFRARALWLGIRAWKRAARTGRTHGRPRLR